MERMIEKRDGSIVAFDYKRIEDAILKAMINGSGRVDNEIAVQIAMDIAHTKADTVSDVETLVFNLLIAYGHRDTARAYEGYRALQEYKRETNTTDDSILGLINELNDEVMYENSNKNPRIASTQRDLIAGEVSKDLAKRKLIPTHLVQAHESGAIHIHDMDYIMQPIFNCCLIDLEDMLQNGTVINGKMVDSPKSFQTACTITTQIIAQVASNQYGGSSINGIDRILAPFVRKSYNKYLDNVSNYVEHEVAEALAVELTRKEVSAGIQTIQYQINTLMTTNGQSPFVTLFMHFDPESEYAKESALIQEEILIQRLKGVKNEAGVYTTPAFPKLIYVLDEHNVHDTSEYRYLTDLAVKCTAKRMYPDYISAKKMAETYEGNVFSPMGCRAFLSPYKDETGRYRFDGRFNLGVTTLNLPQIALKSGGDMDLFWKILEERVELVKEMSLTRVELLENVTSDVSPIHWQHGAIARLGKGESISHLFRGGYATITMGYIGLYEVSRHMLGMSHTATEGSKQFTLQILQFLKDKTIEWKEETGLAFALYGTPSENTAGRLCEIDKSVFGDVEDITDKGFYTNSYHVDVREDIDAFEKLGFEADYQEISTGGCISYVEMPDLTDNPEVISTVVQFIYDNITYAEFNTKSDYCFDCGFDGEIVLNDEDKWECPVCGNTEESRMTVVRRTCGYLGENYWGIARTKDIKNRKLHL